MRVFNGVDELAGAIGEELGPSEWVEISQERIDLFAAATEDHQWIHVDPVRAAEGPFGATIAHGFLTLSLIPRLGQEIFDIRWDGPRMNYGLNKVRFPTPVRVGSRVRCSARVLEVQAAPTGTQVVIGYAIEVEGAHKPACIAETVVLLLVGAPEHAPAVDYREASREATPTSPANPPLDG